jgi:hypothetical protein
MIEGLFRHAHPFADAPLIVLENSQGSFQRPIPTWHVCGWGQWRRNN